MTATLTDAAGVTLTGRTITWLSGDSTKVRVSSTGVVAAVAAGATPVGAIREGQLATASITVSPPNTALTLRDSLVTTTQGLFMGAASRDLSRIAVGPNVDASSTTRDLLFTDFTGAVLARHDVGGATWAVAMTPDGARTVVGSDDEQVYVFQGTALRNRGRPLSGNTQVRGVAISDDGRWAGTGGQRFVLLDLEAATPLTPVYVDSTLTQTRAMDFASGGRWLAYGGRQEIGGRQLSIVAVYDLTSRTRVLWDTIPTTAENGELRSLAISSDGNRIIAGDWAGHLHYYVRSNPASTTWSRSTQDVASRVYWVDLTADASRAVVGTQGSDLRRYDLSSTAATLAWKRPAAGVPLNPPMDGGQRTVHITPDGRSISAGTRGGGSGGGQIFVFDANGNVRLGRASFASQVAAAWKARAGAADPEVWFVRVSDDGTRAVMASFGGILYFFTGNAP
ncbi:MAG: WD40 repeat domain-containing protein [Gemmatimonadota bacterium]